ncbi:MAG: hypothetical protein ACTSRL_22520, partial [Candidatus Helarchaeota archaeon]
PDGKQVIAGSSDNSITVWNPKKGIRIAEVLHGSEVTALATYKNFIVAGDWLGYIKIWQL